MREQAKLPEFLRNIERAIEMVEWGPTRLRWLQERLAMFRQQTEQAQSAQS
ncbi:MAG TPA: hypothetical protein VNN73_13605 [Blastocatellia bacterium]|jgi:hypothetical protein|nr:hypothetical protein [Blastocatellia bacterium]